MIKAKQKKCKGTGKAKGYGCDALNWRRTYGLGHECKCYQNWLLNSEEGKKIVRERTLKITKPRIELKKAMFEKKQRKNLQWYLNDVRSVVHEAVRLRDKGKRCISCGCEWKPNFQAGHYYKAELYSILRFNFDNIHGQCEQCNLRKEGNLNGYSKNLPLRIGKEKFEALKKIADANFQTAFKYDKEMLKKIKKEAIIIRDRYKKAV